MATRSWPRVYVATAVVVIVLAAVAIGVRINYVHAHTWAWSIVAPQAPPKVEFRGRDYQRVDLPTPAVLLPANAVTEGYTLGGAPISGVPTTSPMTQTLIWVVDSAGHVWGYALLGGP